MINPIFNHLIKDDRIILGFIQVFQSQADIRNNRQGTNRFMADTRETLSVSKAARICGVGRTTVGYWIRSKKLYAIRMGRNYSIPVQDLLFFLHNQHQKIPVELLPENSSKPIFKSFQNCWQYWHGSEHGLKCRNCITFINQLQACFTVKDSGLSGCSDCSTCRYYTETYLHRIQFVHQLKAAAAVFKDLYLWGGNSRCAEICNVQQRDLIGMGLDKIVHADSLPKVIETVRKLALGESEVRENCIIAVNCKRKQQKKVCIAVYPLHEPAKSYLVLGVPFSSNRKFFPHQNL